MNILLPTNGVLRELVSVTSHPLAIAIDSNGDVYVTDTTSVSNQIQKFTNNGTFITSWNVLGTGDGTFTNARGIGIDSADNV
jgi:DNA-binding beta-propeller fold protein YncE